VRGPGGQPLTLHRSRPRPLLIGAGAGIGPTLFVAERLRELSAPPSPSSASSPAARWRPLVLLGSTGLPFPFRPRPSVIVVPGIPTGVIACMPLLEEWGVASRLASTSDLPGCFDGDVITLADTWLGSLSPSELAEVEIFANGADAMVREAAKLAKRYGIAHQGYP
jgi:dihydroorotate dehydrogenase electron transfer subunit